MERRQLADKLMSYEFKNDESIPDGVRRIVREEVASATEKVKVKKVQDRDLAIHEVRKGVKRVRGLLKLMRPALGEAYEKEDQAWRELGQRLSALRDAGVMMGAFGELRASCPPRLYNPIRRRLLENKREKSLDAAGILAKVAAGLKRAETRLKSWPLHEEGFPAIGPGMKRTYRRGFRALRKARTEPSPENLHELRRRSKEHLYQLRLLEGLWDGKLHRHEKRVRHLEELLGAHQNLAVLKTKILEQPVGLGKPADVEKFLKVLDEMETDLTVSALKTGARVYGNPSGRWEKRVQRLWNNWVKPVDTPKTS
jgi:CHAD domain-containing protein